MVEEDINENEQEPKDTLNKLLQEVSKPKTQSNETTTVNKVEEVSEENISALNAKNVKEKPENNSAADEILKADKKEEKRVNLQSLLYPEREQDQGEQTEQNSNQNSDSELNAMVKDVISNAKAQTRNFQAVRETFDNFSSNLKEQVAAYKSPFMRFNITLNPLNLGEVEITMVNRGNNLHINFNSNTQTMNLFLQNQAEFKNSLVNMGFTELEMNFSDQNQPKKEQGQKGYKGSKFSSDDTEQGEPTAPRLELVIPRYV
nr:flagellar hook-length control protein FliK [uncultured Campylobacter sp.]